MTAENPRLKELRDELAEEIKRMGPQTALELEDEMAGDMIQNLRHNLRESYVRMIAERGAVGHAQFVMLVCAAAVIEGWSDADIKDLMSGLACILNRSLDIVDGWLAEGEYHIKKEARP